MSIITRLTTDWPDHAIVSAGDDEGRTVAELLEEIAGLRIALQTRDIIGQAKGIIRVLTHRDDASAFQLLSQLSQDTNRPVREVAEQIAESSGSGRPLPAELVASWHRHTT